MLVLFYFFCKRVDIHSRREDLLGWVSFTNLTWFWEGQKKLFRTSINVCFVSLVVPFLQWCGWSSSGLTGTEPDSVGKWLKDAFIYISYSSLGGDSRETRDWPKLDRLRNEFIGDVWWTAWMNASKAMARIGIHESTVHKPAESFEWSNITVLVQVSEDDVRQQPQLSTIYGTISHPACSFSFFVAVEACHKVELQPLVGCWILSEHSSNCS